MTSRVILRVTVCMMIAMNWGLPGHAGEGEPISAKEPTPANVLPPAKGFVFTTEKSLPCTPVKNQAKTGTCWSFATNSFLEAELLRIGKGEVDLSEMFIVRMTYPKKVQRYVRLHGNSVLDQGSLAGDAECLPRIRHAARGGLRWQVRGTRQT